MTTLAATALFALTTLAHPAPDDATAAARLARIADTVAASVERAETLPFRCSSGAARCEEAERASVIALVTIGWHESKFAEDVADCRRCERPTKWCDGGRAVTAYQMQRGAWLGETRGALCADPVLAGTVALAELARRNVPIEAAFYGYAGRPRTGAELVALFRKLAKGAAIRIRGTRGASIVVDAGDAS